MRGRAAIAAMAAVALLAACGVGPEERAHSIGETDVPYGLVDTEPAGATTSTPGGTTVALYLVRDDQLVEVERELPRGEGLVDLARMLAAAPSELESAGALTSAVSEPEVFREVEVVRGTAEVDLDASFSELEGSAQALAIAQTVFTLTARPGIGRVLFSLDGAPAEVPRGDGTLTDEALARDDFPDLLATE